MSEQEPCTGKSGKEKAEKDTSQTFSEDQMSELADLFSVQDDEKDMDDTGEFPAFREEDMKPTEDENG
jgi:hypothetical protein